jgi:hypothetical protein
MAKYKVLVQPDANGAIREASVTAVAFVVGTDWVTFSGDGSSHAASAVAAFPTSRVISIQAEDG